MKYGLLSITVLILANISCTTSQSPALRWVEDIPFDPAVDNPNFELCFGEDHAIQYYRVSNNTGSKHNKPKFVSFIEEQTKSIKFKNESGYIRVRFIVNCKGEADRFRILESSLDNKPKSFSKQTSEKLLKVIKAIDKWHTGNNMTKTDFYLYVLFKIVDGKIVKILP